MRRLSPIPTIVALAFALSALMAPVASAQVPGTSLPGITVQGTGTATAPAEIATVVLVLIDDQVFMPMDGGMMPEPESTPDLSPQERAQPVIDALVNAGVPPADIELLLNPFSTEWGPYGGPISINLRFTIQNPTPDALATLLDPALTAATDAGLHTNMTGVLYGVSDCASLQREAMANAIADGHAAAEEQAALLDVKLGDLTASRVDPYAALMFGGYQQVNACMPIMVAPGLSSIWSVPPFDPAAPAEVTIQANIELTFEMERPLSATPAG